jgi:hypothetical protein
MAAEREPEQTENPLADALLCGPHSWPVLQDQRGDVALADPGGRMPHEEMADKVVNLQIGADCLNVCLLGECRLGMLI